MILLCFQVLLLAREGQALIKLAAVRYFLFASKPATLIDLVIPPPTKLSIAARKRRVIVYELNGPVRKLGIVLRDT